ncbi:MAG: DUF4019 domain-containing protein [bacterium]
MKTNLAITFLVLCGLLLHARPLARAGDTPEQAAGAAGAAWLALVDQGRYAESWKEAAPYFRNAVPEAQWVQSLTAVRQPLGKVLSRKQESARYATALPGAPDGEYVILVFHTSFENKRTAVETVTPMRGQDGKWQVSGYYIK